MEKKKNIIIIGPLPPPIHGESIALNSIYQSGKLHDEFEVTMINTNRETIGKQGSFSAKKIVADVKIICRALLKSLSFQKPIVYLSLSQSKLGLIRDCLIIKLTSIAGRADVITHLHGNNLANVIEGTGGLLKIFFKTSLKKVDAAIVLGESISHNYLGYPKNIKAVANGVPADFIQRDEVKQQKKVNTLSLLYLSNMMKGKGYSRLVHAVMELAEKGYSLQLNLVGGIEEDSSFQHCMEQVKQREMEQVITYHGIKSGQEKKRLFLEADIMVLPTSYPIEGQPISLIEGMAAGLPIISTDQGVIAELIQNCGIVTGADTASIKEAIVTLYEDTSLRQRLSKAGREDYEAYYTEDKYIDALLDIFKGVD